MIRNLKRMGLALVAVFAMSAMGAAGAQAEKVADFDAQVGTVKVDIEPDGHHIFVFGGKTITCTVIDGHAAYPGPTASSSTVTNIGYTNCHTTTLGLSFPTTVTMDAGCHYTYTAGTYVAASDDSTGSVHICGTTIDTYTNHADHTAGKLRCQVHVPAQLVNGIKFTNKITPAGNNKMAITVDTTNTLVTTTVTDFNTLGCNNHEHGTATSTGHIWLKGTDKDNNYTDLTVKGT